MQPACIDGGAHGRISVQRCTLSDTAFVSGQGYLVLLSVLLVSQVTMGRGDKRTAKGKRKAGSHGNCRPSNGARRRAAAAKKAEAPASEE